MLDSITFGLSGVLGSGKDILSEAITETYRDEFLRFLQGNFWVPQEIVCPTERRNKDLFQGYSEDPHRYAFPYQAECLANRMECQRAVDRTQGIVLQKQPLAVERATFGEANRGYMGDLFQTYDNLSNQAIAGARPVDVHIYLRFGEEDIPELQERIRASGRPGEQKYCQDPSYLLDHIRLHESYFESCSGIPVITIDATHPAFRKDSPDKNYLQEVIKDIVTQAREFIKPPRFPLYKWEQMDYNTAQEAARRGRFQLRDCLKEELRILSFAGLVSSNKTGLAKLVSAELEMGLTQELEGRNSVINDPLLFTFLDAKRAYELGRIPIHEVREHCYNLQVSLIEKRPSTREEAFARGRSFGEDRSIEEDPEIFWPLFVEQGFLTVDQVVELEQMAKERYGRTIKSDLLIQTQRPALDCKILSIGRGREVEQEAWTLEDMEIMEGLYNDRDGRDFVTRARDYGALKGPSLVIDMTKFKSDNNRHLGWLWQEIMHELMDLGKLEKAA